MAIKRVTQKQVAEAAGVHSTTVSMVFRNHPAIAKSTNERIRSIAQKMGYTPDPMLSALAAYRTSRRPPAFNGNLAWLTNSGDGFDWKTSPHFREYYRASCQRALDHGYRFEEFDIHAYRKSPTRLASILRSRNIRGILLCPQPHANTEIDFPWENFSLVTFGYSLLEPKVNRVAFAYYRSILRTLDAVLKRGYTRVGLVTLESDNARFEYNVLASYLAHHYTLTRKISIPPLLGDYRKQPKLLKPWLGKHQPDAIVCQDWRVLDALKTLNIYPPQDIGLACAGFPSGTLDLSGIQENSQEIAIAATDLLTAMVQRGERGVPPKAQQILIDGDWVEGTTLRSVQDRDYSEHCPAPF
jgi:LacI family transcriptional regulator/LacI family repressor for deo operon, udp, cdd, tsx, nupC, and nupG